MIVFKPIIGEYPIKEIDLDTQEPSNGSYWNVTVERETRANGDYPTPLDEAEAYMAGAELAIYVRDLILENNRQKTPGIRSDALKKAVEYDKEADNLAFLANKIAGFGDRPLNGGGDICGRVSEIWNQVGIGHLGIFSLFYENLDDELGVAVA